MGCFGNYGACGFGGIVGLIIILIVLQFVCEFLGSACNNNNCGCVQSGYYNNGCGCGNNSCGCGC